MLDLSSPLSTLQVLTLIYALVHDALAILHKCVVNFGKLSLPSVTFSVVTHVRFPVTTRQQTQKRRDPP